MRKIGELGAQPDRLNCLEQIVATHSLSDFHSDNLCKPMELEIRPHIPLYKAVDYRELGWAICGKKQEGKN